MLTLWLQVQVQVCFSLPVIVHFRCLSLIPGFMSDPEFYVSSYYSGCSHEQTRDRLAGDARVADSEASRRLPRMIYRYSPCVVGGRYLGISSVPPLSCFCSLRQFEKL